MKINICGSNKKISIGENKNWNTITSGNIKIEFLENEKIYVISRTDNKPFDKTENIKVECYGNATPPKTLEQIITHQVNALSLLQTIPLS